MSGRRADCLRLQLLLLPCCCSWCYYR